MQHSQWARTLSSMNRQEADRDLRAAVSQPLLIIRTEESLTALDQLIERFMQRPNAISQAGQMRARCREVTVNPPGGGAHARTACGDIRRMLPASRSLTETLRTPAQLNFIPNG